MCPLVNSKILKHMLKSIQRHVCMHYPQAHGGNALVATPNQWGLLLRLLLLSRFSRVRLCATPEMAAHQAPPSLGFSRQEHFLLQCRKVKSESEVAQSCPILGDPMDCSPPGSSVHGIFQARVLESGKCSAPLRIPRAGSSDGQAVHKAPRRACRAERQPPL